MLATCEVGKAEEEGQRVGDSSMAKYLEGRKEAQLIAQHPAHSFRALLCQHYCTTPQNTIALASMYQSI